MQLLNKCILNDVFCRRGGRKQLSIVAGSFFVPVFFWPNSAIITPVSSIIDYSRLLEEKSKQIMFTQYFSDAVRIRPLPSEGRRTLVAVLAQSILGDIYTNTDIF